MVDLSHKVDSTIDFSRLTLTEAALILDNNSDTKRIADWLCELSNLRRAINNIEEEIARTSR